MADDDGERLDWGNDDDEQQAAPDSYPGYSPRQSIGGGYAGVPEDAEDAVSLGGDDDDERQRDGADRRPNLDAAAGGEESPEVGDGADLGRLFGAHGRQDRRRRRRTPPQRTTGRRLASMNAGRAPVNDTEALLSLVGLLAPKECS